MSRVLVIEDNEQNLYLTTYLLEKHGFEVLQARSGEEGIRVAVRDEPELILLDVQLPRRDGHEVARELRQRPETAEIPIIAVTSHAMAGDRERAIEAGCEGYLTKPIDPDRFVDQISRFLD